MRIGSTGAKIGAVVFLAIFISSSFYLVLFARANPGSLEGYVENIENTILLSGVNVSLYNSTTGALVNSTLTDSNGHFDFPSLTDYTYNITFTKTGYIQRNITYIVSGANITNNTMFRDNYTAYNITITDYQNSMPLANANVNITWSQGYSNYEKTTDSNGNIVMELPGNRSDGSFTAIHTFNVSSNQGYVTNDSVTSSGLEGVMYTIDINLKGGCAVSGYVNDKYRETLYSVIPGAIVEAYDDVNSSELNYSNIYFYNSTANAQGYYSLYIPNSLLGGNTSCDPYVHTSATGYEINSTTHPEAQDPMLNISMTGAAIINGTIKDRGQGVNSATVTIKDGGDLNKDYYITESDSSGMFSIFVKDGENKTIQVSRSGYFTASNATNYSSNIEYTVFNISGKGELTGTVVDKQNNTITLTNVNVTITPETSGVSYTILTDGSGVFNLNVSTDPNNYTMVLTKSAYNNNNSVEFSFTLDGSESQDLGNILMTGSNQINGTIYDQLNMQDQTVDNVSVGVSIGSNIYNVTSNSNGFYEVFIPSTGDSYTLSYNKLGYNITEHTSTVIDNVVDILQLTGATHISGTVTDIDNSEPIEGALLKFFNPTSGEFYYNTTSLSDGSYSFDLGVDFNFSFNITKQGYLEYSNGIYQWDQSRNGPDITANPGMVGETTINITMKDYFNQSVNLDNVDVCVVYDTDCEYNKVTNSNGTTNFNIRGGDNYTLRFNRINYLQKTYPENGSSMLGDFGQNLTLGAHAKVNVTDKYAVSSESGIENANVYLYQYYDNSDFDITLNQTTLNVTVTCNSSFRNSINVTLEGIDYSYTSSVLTSNDWTNATFTMVPLGTSNLTIDGSLAGCGINSTNIEIESSGTVQNESVDVEITYLKVNVTAPNNEPLSGVFVYAPSDSNVNCTTGLSGNCTIDFMIAGEQNVTGNLTNYFLTNKSYNITAGAVNDKISDPIVMNPMPGNLSVLVINETGSGLANINVTIRNSTYNATSQTSSGWANFTDMVGLFNISINGTDSGYNYTNSTDNFVLPVNNTIHNVTLEHNLFSVTVIDAQSMVGVNGTNVTLYNLTDGEISINGASSQNTLLTNTTGQAVFTRMIPMTYNVTVTGDGFDADIQNITIVNGFNEETIIIGDTNAPDYSNNGIINSTPSEGDNVYIYSYWTDNAYLEQAILQTNESGSFVNTSTAAMSGSTSWSNFTLSSSYTTTNVAKTIAWKIIGKDKSGNWNTTMVESTFTITDITAPTVSVGASPPNPDGLDTILINATVTDNVNVTNVSIFLDYELQKVCTFSPSETPVSCTVEVGPFTAGTKHYYYATAYDDAGNGGRDPVSETTLVTKSTTLSPKRQKFDAVYDSVNDVIYMVGGRKGAAAPAEQEYLTNIDVYNPETELVTATGATLTIGREAASASFETVGNNVYIFGGFNETFFNDVLLYNVSNNSVSDVASISAKSLTSSGFSTYDNRIYNFGGFNASGRNNETLEFNPTNNQVTAKNAINDSRSRMAIVWDSNQQVFYLFGGYNTSGNATNWIEEYDPAGNSNSGKSNLLSTTLPSELHGASAAFYPVTNVSYIFGGCNETNGSFSEILKFNGTNVETITTQFSTGRCYTAAAYNSLNNSIMIFGGTDYSDEISEVIEFTPITANWFFVDPVGTGKFDIEVRDQDYNLLPNISVNITGPVTTSGTTNSTGYVSFNILAGSYTMNIDGTNRGYGINTSGVTLVTGINNISVNINTTILVVNATEPDGDALQLATVTLYNDSTGIYVSKYWDGTNVTGVTDNDGFVTFSRILPCTNCNVTVVKPAIKINYSIETINAGENITADIDPPSTDPFNETYTLNFTLNSGHQNADNIVIEIKDNDGLLAGTNTTTNGSALISGIVSGVYDIIVNGSSAGFDTYTRDDVNIGKIVINNGTTNSQGIVTIDVTGTIDYYVYVSPSGYLEYDDIDNSVIRMGAYDDSGTATPTSNINNTIDLEINGSVFLNGHVKDDNFYNPIEFSYEPISSANVNVYYPSCDGTLRYSLQTNESGLYNAYISNTLPGGDTNATYCIKSDATGFLNSDENYKQDMTFNSTETLNIGLDGNSTVSGHVYVEGTTTPIENANVLLKSNLCYNSSSQCSAYLTTTNSSGFFTMQVNPNSLYTPYEIEISAVGFMSNESVLSSIPNTGGSYTLGTGYGMLIVNVTSNVGDLITDNSTIELFNSKHPSGRTLSGTSTDCSLVGNILTCSLDESELGQNTLVTNGTAYGFGTNTTIFSISQSETVYLNITLDATQFNVTLSDDYGNPMSNVIVNLSNINNEYVQNTSNGFTTFNNFPTGTYNITFSGNGTDVYSHNNTNNGTVTISNAGTLTSNSYTLNQTTVSINITNDTYSGLSNLDVTLTHTVTGSIITNTTEADGTFNLGAIPHGNYNVTFNNTDLISRGLATTSEIIYVTPGEKHNGTNAINIVLSDVEVMFNISNSTNLLNGINVTVFLDDTVATNDQGSPLTGVTNGSGILVFNAVTPTAQAGGDYTYTIYGNTSGYGISAGNAITVETSGADVSATIERLSLNITVNNINGSSLTENVNITLLKSSEIAINTTSLQLTTSTLTGVNFESLYVDNYTLNISSNLYHNETFPKNLTWGKENFTIGLKRVGIGYFNNTVVDESGALADAIVTLKSDSTTVDNGSSNSNGIILLESNASLYNSSLTIETSKSGCTLQSVSPSGPYTITDGEIKNLTITFSCSGDSGDGDGDGGSGGGGGSTGGSGGGGSSCEEEWVCTAWSSCVDEIHTRNCNDKNECGTSVSKPTESESCYSSMDISISSVYLNAGECVGTDIEIDNTGNVDINNINMDDVIQVNEWCIIKPSGTVTKLVAGQQVKIPISVCAGKTGIKGDYEKEIFVYSDEMSGSVTIFVHVTKEYSEVLNDKVIELTDVLNSYKNLDEVQQGYYLTAEQALDRATEQLIAGDTDGAEQSINQAESYLNRLKDYSPTAAAPMSLVMIIIPIIVIVIVLIWWFGFRTKSYSYKMPRLHKPETKEKKLPRIKKSSGKSNDKRLMDLYTKSRPAPSKKNLTKNKLIKDIDKLNKRIMGVNIKGLRNVDLKHYKIAKDALSDVGSFVRTGELNQASLALKQAKKSINYMEMVSKYRKK